MSREEFGNDVADSVASRPEPSSVPGRADPAPASMHDTSTSDTSTRIRDPGMWTRTRLAAASVVVALSALAGFGGARVWNDASVEGAALGSDPVAWAVVVGTRPAPGIARTVLDLVVRLTNLGRSPIAVSGSEATRDAGAIESVAPEGLAVEAGSSAEILVHASVDCTSPQPLRLYPIQVRRSDQSLHSVQVMGGTAALARSCGSQPERARVILLTEAVEEDGHLRLTLSSPTGRTTRVLDIRAGGVALTGEPLRGLFDTRPWTTWIRPPGTCPAEWARAGLPRAVAVDVDVGGTATVPLDTGDALPRWLLKSTCRAPA